jgi:undecaprenyl-diphosphatase
MRIDQGLFDLLHSLAGRNVFGDTLLQFCATYLPYLVGAAFFVLLARFKDWRLRTYYFIEALLAVILARGIVTEAIYHFYPSVRPFVALGFEPLVQAVGSNSFPSGHAAFFFALAAAVYLARRDWGIAYLGFACVIAAARVAVGVHWPFDVVVGAAIGIGSALVVRGLLYGQYRRLTTKPVVADNEPVEMEKVAEA